MVHHGMRPGKWLSGVRPDGTYSDDGSVASHFTYVRDATIFVSEYVGAA